jgi:hypothetical protein
MAAFVHVRKAYRLLWLYQQTLMDTYNEMVRHLNVRYYRTELDPLQRDINPTQKPPRTLLPLLWISTLYLNRTGDADQQRPDDYLVDIVHIADTGYLNANYSTNNGYPTHACAARTASSELRLFVFHATATSAVNWYSDIWQKTNYPGHDTMLNSEAQPTIQVYGYHFDVATLTDQQAIATQMAQYKGRVNAALRLQL